MAVGEKHPKYSEFIEDWEVCRDTYRGERCIKDKGQKYLAATNGMIQDGISQPGQAGYEAYSAYKMRAVFPEFVSDAVETLLGMMWTKPPVITLPGSMQGLLESATIEGEGLHALLRRINENQLVTGRLGLLADLPEDPDPTNPLPYIALYQGEDIINWDDMRQENGVNMLNLVILDESGYERQEDFKWKYTKKHRMLAMGDVSDKDVNTPYRSGLFLNDQWSEEELSEPGIRGVKLDQIPFVFVNTKDVLSSPDDPPLLGLATLCLAIYRGEADYRQALFMQGQDTLVLVGGEEEKSYRIGAGANIIVPIDGDAKFIGVESEGLLEMRSALENDKTLAQQRAGNLVDTRTKQKESGEAMQTRLGAQTATLNQIARTGAYALEQLLKKIAIWVGADPEEVIVEPNLEFETRQMTGRDLVDIMAAKNMGAPLSNETIHRQMLARGMTQEEYQSELDLLAAEEPLVEGNEDLDPSEVEEDPPVEEEN